MTALLITASEMRLSWVETAAETGELAEMAPVSRELVLLPRDQLNAGGGGTPAPWIDNIPANFSGRVTMLQPQHVVEVSLDSV